MPLGSFSVLLASSPFLPSFLTAPTRSGDDEWDPATTYKVINREVDALSSD
jgi:hypothetical protein